MYRKKYLHNKLEEIIEINNLDKIYRLDNMHKLGLIDSGGNLIDNNMK